MSSNPPLTSSPLGVLPSGWEVKPLKSLCTKIGSGATPRGGKDVYLEERESHALIRSQHVYDHYFDEVGLAYITEEHVQELRNVEVQQNDLLLNITGDGITFSRVCMVPNRILPACVNQHVAIVRANSSICSPGYLLGYLTLPNIKTYIESFNSGGSRRAITKGNIESFEIPLPPLNEQKEIAKTLGILNEKIENLRKQNETLEAIAQTLFKHWFIDFEFPNADGKPYKSSSGAMEPSELGEIPAGWHVKPLKECLEHLIDNRGKTPEFFDAGIPALSAKFVKGGDLVNRDNFNYISYDLFEQSEKLKVGDVILTSEAPLGETFFIARETNYYPAQRVFALRANPEIISGSYLNYWLSSSIGQFLLKRRASGSTVQGIKQSELYQVEVIIPDTKIQNLAAKTLMQVLVKKERNSDQIQTLTKTRDALLPKLMSGQLRIQED